MFAERNVNEILNFLLLAFATDSFGAKVLALINFREDSRGAKEEQVEVKFECLAAQIFHKSSNVNSLNFQVNCVLFLPPLPSRSSLKGNKSKSLSRLQRIQIENTSDT
jgi:hypothetical protein